MIPITKEAMFFDKTNLVMDIGKGVGRVMYSEDIKEDNLWLMKGDCLERMKEIPDGSVDLILTDPPCKLGANHYSTWWR